jgi:uncharacterized membrane protein YbhN (UPF0104 family)
MVRSRHYTFGVFFLTMLSIVFLVLAISAVSCYFFHFRIIKMQLDTPSRFLFAFIFTTAAFVFFVTGLWRNIIIVTINSADRLITFRYFFSRQTVSYSFDDFDGFITFRVYHGRSGSYEGTGFVKNGIMIQRIDSYYFSNYDALRKNFDTLPFLGERKLGFARRMKMIFNSAIEV